MARTSSSPAGRGDSSRGSSLLSSEEEEEREELTLEGVTELLEGMLALLEGGGLWLLAGELPGAGWEDGLALSGAVLPG